MACKNTTSNRCENANIKTFGNRTKSTWCFLSNSKRRNFSTSGWIRYRKNYDSTSTCKMVWCWYYSLYWLWRTWKWNDRCSWRISKVNWPKNFKTAYGKNNFNSKYFKYAGCCPWSFNLYWNNYCRVL